MKFCRVPLRHRRPLGPGKYPSALCRKWASILGVVAPRSSWSNGAGEISDYWEIELASQFGRGQQLVRQQPRFPAVNRPEWLPSDPQWAARWSYIPAVPPREVHSPSDVCRSSQGPSQGKGQHHRASRTAGIPATSTHQVDDHTRQLHEAAPQVCGGEKVDQISARRPGPSRHRARRAHRPDVRLRGVDLHSPLRRVRHRLGAGYASKGPEHIALVPRGAQRMVSRHRRPCKRSHPRRDRSASRAANNGTRPHRHDSRTRIVGLH
jgi:hypothetical protein